MPELPEVETARRGLAPVVVGQTVRAVVVRQRRLRWPVPRALVRDLPGETILSVGRRAKYLLFATTRGTAIVHFGMTGSLRVVPAGTPAGAHDHVDLVLASGQCLRLHDPRRFGCLLWTRSDPARHVLLARLGPEPLTPAFDGEHLFRVSRARTCAIRDLLLDGRIVAGVGNIYANEALFLARIDPRRAAGGVGRRRYDELAKAIRRTLEAALEASGTTLRDFVGADGRPGGFEPSLRVYGREGQGCPRCGTTIRARNLGQRRAYFCPRCQR